MPGGAVAEDLLPLLRAIFTEVRAFLLGAGRGHLETVRMNPRGDVSKAFDLEAEERIIAGLREGLAEPVRVLTEERGEVLTKPGRPAYTIIVDPVDGSENFARGNDCTAVSLAVLRPEDLRPEAVLAGLVGHVHTGTTFEASRRGGARRGGRPIAPSAVGRLEEALVAVDLNFRDKGTVPRIFPLLARARDLRRYGSAALELAGVASGGADGYVDVRGTLSPENYLAAALIVREAGGLVTDWDGNPLAPVRSLTQGQTIVAAGTAALHMALLEAVREGRAG